MLHDVIGDRMIAFAASALYCIVNGEENPFPAIGDTPVVNMSEEDRASYIGNMHKNW